MGFNIDLTGLRMKDHAKLLDHVTVKGNGETHIKVIDSEISGNASVLNDLEIESVLEELNQEVQAMDKNSREYYEIQKILKTQKWDKGEFVRCITKHLAEFSQGVLASVVANFLT